MKVNSATFICSNVNYKNCPSEIYPEYAFTGRSNVGKSSLINQTLYPCLAREYYASNIKPLPYKGLEGTLLLDKIIDINQSPIGKTPRLQKSESSTERRY